MPITRKEKNNRNGEKTMITKYIIMAGGKYEHWQRPRHLSIVNGEELIARTIRLLKENGVEDISISTDNPIFEKFNLPILKHDNSYRAKWHDMKGDWLDCFYPTEEPVCYILGDVYFSDEAIKTIVESDTKDIELFGSIPPFTDDYIKKHIEAFALKVANLDHFKEALKETRKLDKQGKFWRKPPIIWELWEVITKVPISKREEKYQYNYTKINDYTCDIDWEEDILKLEKIVGGGEKMIKLQAIERFTLGRFDELKNIERAGIETHGMIYVGDKFECTRELADYLLGNNALGKPFVKVIEVIPEAKVIEPKFEEATEIKEPKKTTKRSKKK